MKIKVKDLSEDLVEEISNIDCGENCGICSFCRDSSFMGMTCIPMFIKTMRISKEHQNEEIDISSLYTKEYDNIIDLLEDNDFDEEFISDLKESIKRKEEVKRDLGVVYKYLKDSCAGKEVIRSFENIENYLENE